MGRVARIGALLVMILAVLQAGAWPAAGAMAVGPPGLRADFNGDGFEDLAVGVPLEDHSGAVDAGVVNVFYGSAAGVAGGGRQQLMQGLPESGDELGWALAAGDFNGDSIADLAVGAPGEDVGATVDAGAVEVWYGTPGGLPAVGDQLLRQGAAGVIGAAEAGDSFGLTLVSGLFDSGAVADLAIGAPFENVGADTDAGAVNVVYGAAGGLLEGRNQQFLQANPEPDDLFGVALATGHMDNQCDEPAFDLAVGASGEDVGGARDAGAVHIIQAANDGSGLPSGATGQTFIQGSGGVPGTAETGDGFGAALAASAGIFSGLGNCVQIGLAIGAPEEDVGTAADAGAVTLLMTPDTHQQWTQGRAGGSVESRDLFGWSLTMADIDGNNADNVLIGAPGENLGTTVDAGAVTALCGFDGLVFACGPDGTITQTNPERADAAGVALAAGDFNNDTIPDLAVGAPGESVGAAAEAGAVEVYAGVNVPPIPDSGVLLFQNAPGVPGTSEAGDIFGVGLAGSFTAPVL
jgi:FG-GAP repeat